MSVRTSRAVLASLLGTLCLALPLVVGTVAEAAPQAMSLALVEGELSLRDSEEPAQLATPTTLVGNVDDATGALTGSLAIAPLEFSFDITSPIAATVFVDASFSELTPGSTFGSVNKQGDVTVSASVKVDLHVEVGSPAILSADCTATPISLGLSSTAPYDEGSGQVTLVDDNFSVPTVPSTPTCSSLISGGVNERLAGSGHSLEMVMSGTLPRPTVGDAPTETTVEVAPATTREGKEVTISAVVAATEGTDEPIPTGLVEVRDGNTLIGDAVLDAEGKATYTTSSLAVGAHQLSVGYRGDDTYAPSTSGSVEHTVTAWPTVEVAMPSTMVIGGPSLTATLTLTNPGTTIENGRVDIDIARAVGTGLFDPSRVVAEWLDGTTWEEIPLATTAPRAVGGSAGPATGFAFPAGSTRTVKVRVRVPVVEGTPSPTACTAANPTCPGNFRLRAKLQSVAPADGTLVEPLAEAQQPFTLVDGTRRASTMTLIGDSVRPHTVRQGFTIEALVVVGPSIAGNPPSGLAEVFVDGRQLPARTSGTPYVTGYRNQLPLAPNGSVAAQALLPPDIDPGAHLVTIRYLGDPIFAPVEVTRAFTVLPAAGQPVVCRQDGFTLKHEWGANLVVEADLPAAAASGSTVDVGLSTVRILGARPTTLSSDPWYAFTNNATTPVGTNPLRAIAIGLGPDGSGTAAAVQRQGAALMPASPNPADPSMVDQAITLQDATGSVVVEGEPGDRVPVELDEVAVDFVLSGSNPLPLHASCKPVDGPLELGEVEIAGTTVSVDPDGPVREGTDEVTIDAATFPATAAGTVTFTSDLDGELGTGAVTDGAASLDTDELSPGTHQIRAWFDATDPAVPDTTSVPVALEVTYSPRTGTEAFVIAARNDFLGSAEEADVLADAALIAGGRSKPTYLGDLAGSDPWLTRIVEGMYDDLLGRPGDPAGVAFWVRRLKAGWTVAEVAGAFYSSSEYFTGAGGGTVPSWVDDLYLKLLGRPADAAGRAYWVRQVAAKGRPAVAHRFYQSTESARARVAARYEELLGRTPSAAEVEPWVARVIARGDLVLAVNLAASREYATRALVRFPLV